MCIPLSRSVHRARRANFNSASLTNFCSYKFCDYSPSVTGSRNLAQINWLVALWTLSRSPPQSRHNDKLGKTHFSYWRRRCERWGALAPLLMPLPWGLGHGELPDMMSAKIPPCPHLDLISSDSYYKIHTTSLTTSAFPWPPTDADIISGSSLTWILCLCLAMQRSRYLFTELRDLFYTT